MAEDEKQKLITHYEKYFPNHNCPVCTSKNWEVSNMMFGLQEVRKINNKLGIDDNIYAVIPVNCKTCGNTLFINTELIGLSSK